MAILDIRVLGDPVLREQTKPIADVTEEIQQLVKDLFETMYAAQGIGLAAPQVGRRERIAVVDVGEQPLVFINPEILSHESSARDEEGCLSIPEVFGEVERPAEVTVRALDREGHPFEMSASGLLARCIQHEIDHLDGKLFIDYLSLLKRRAALRKWEGEAKKYPNFTRKIEPGESTTRKSRSRTSHPESDPGL